MKIISVLISETKEIYYEDEILSEFDIHENFIQYVKINKFIKHNRRDGTEYFSVNFNSLIYKTKNWTLNTDCLGILYKKK